MLTIYALCSQPVIVFCHRGSIDPWTLLGYFRSQTPNLPNPRKNSAGAHVHRPILPGPPTAQRASTGPGTDCFLGPSTLLPHPRFSLTPNPAPALLFLTYIKTVAIKWKKCTIFIWCKPKGGMNKEILLSLSFNRLHGG